MQRKGYKKLMLMKKDIHYFKKRLNKVYYSIQDSPGDSMIAIPDRLYEYLRYHSPRISLNIGRVFFNIISIATFFIIFAFTAMLNYKDSMFGSLNSTIANAPVVYLATILSLRNLKKIEIKEDEIDKILLANIIQYRRGYRY